MRGTTGSTDPTDMKELLNTFGAPEVSPPLAVGRSRSTPVYPSLNGNSYSSTTVSGGTSGINLPFPFPTDSATSDLNDPNNPLFQSPSVANLLNHVKYMKSLNTTGPNLD